MNNIKGFMWICKDTFNIKIDKSFYKAIRVKTKTKEKSPDYILIKK
jgi:hypothetical protein